MEQFLTTEKNFKKRAIQDEMRIHLGKTSRLLR
jgi:hypothetical protein